MIQSDAFITCNDGKIRRFIQNDSSECFHYRGKKYTYLLWPEDTGRGFIVMQNIPWKKGVIVLAPHWIQPVLIEAKTWAGQWNWQKR